MFHTVASLAATLLLLATVPEAGAAPTPAPTPAPTAPAAPVASITNERSGTTYQPGELATAVSETEAGDVLVLSKGTFTGDLSTTGHTATIDPSHAIVIRGAGSDNTIIDVTNTNGYGILLEAPEFVAFGPSQPCSQLYGFTLQGPAPNKYYGIHSNPGCNGIVIDDVHVRGTSKTGIDLNGAEDSVLSNIVSVDSLGGFGA